MTAERDDEFTVPARLEAVPDVPPPPPGRLARARLSWASVSDHERVLLAGLIPLAVGCALVYPPLGLIVPGLLLTMIALGFTLAPQKKGGDE